MSACGVALIGLFYYPKSGAALRTFQRLDGLDLAVR